MFAEPSHLQRANDRRTYVPNGPCGACDLRWASATSLAFRAERVAAASQPDARAIAREVFAWRPLPARSDAYAVVEVNDAVSEPPLIEKFELRADVVWQGALAASHHDRAQEQMALIDQPRADCAASELGTPDCDVGT